MAILKALKMRFRIQKKNWPLIRRIIVLIAVMIVCFFLDYFNIPSAIGLNISVINLDLWSIFLSNGIVIVLFMITYSLIDKRNLEKENLADYAGIILLLETYEKCESFLSIIKEIMKMDINDEDRLTDKQVEFISNAPFENDDKLIEFLGNGHITRCHYEVYLQVKRQYETLVFILTGFNNLKNIEDTLLEDLFKLIEKEKEKLENCKKC